MRYDHTAVQVSDIDASIEFYTGNLGFKLMSLETSEELKMRFAFLELEGSKFELIEDLRGNFVKPRLAEPYCPHYCFEVDDMDAALRQLHDQGIEILSGPIDLPGEVFVYFTDPDDNVLEYIQWKDHLDSTSAQ